MSTEIGKESKIMTRVESLFNGAWLGDDEIFAFLEKLKIKFPLANGLENPILISHAPTP